MGSGGKREGAGRKKAERIVSPEVSEKVLRDIGEERLLKGMFALEMHRLGLDLSKKDYGVEDAPRNVSIIPLTNLLTKTQCRARGNPMDTVNHVHDKPIEMNLKVSYIEVIERARKRVSAK